MNRETTDLVEAECDIDLDSGWQRLDVEQLQQQSRAGESSDEVATCTYLVRQALDMRPRSAAAYAEARRTLPYPCMQQEDSPLLSDPASWACAGITVTYVIWHYMPVLVGLWRQMGMPGGKPPCPCCWDHHVQLPDGRELTVGDRYKQLDSGGIQQLQEAGLIGQTLCHGWLRTPYRVAGLGQPELVMAYQYQCKGCPVQPCQAWEADEHTTQQASCNMWTQDRQSHIRHGQKGRTDSC